jgi:tripartite-type tricarboxylate transporter receptor subunit TctC
VTGRIAADVRPSVAPVRVPAWLPGDRQSGVALQRSPQRSTGAVMRSADLKRAVVAALLAVAAPSTAQAQGPADFYKGKSIDLYIGYSAAGGYDVYARVLARHIGRLIPGNPTIVARNMPGAGSLVLANWLYKVAPKDGTAFGMIGRGTAFDPLLGSTKAQFDATKFAWIGSMNDEVSVCVAWHTSGVATLEQAKQKELTVGGTGRAADTDQFPKVLNATLGTRFKLVAGYPGGNEIDLAMERGEVMGRCGWSWSSVVATHKHWFDERKIHVLVQLSLSKHPDLPQVPLIMDLARTDEQRQIFKLVFARQPMGRPFLAPPGLPAERVAILRKAFMDTMKDPDFLAEASRTKLEINPVDGEAVQALVQEVYRTPQDIAKAVAEIVSR